MDHKVSNPPADSVSDRVRVLLDLPYACLEQDEYSREVIHGLQFSSKWKDPQKVLAPVTIKNYLAAHVRKSINTSTPKTTTPRCNNVFIRIPMELQLMVLEYLHPIELCQLLGVSKNIRKVVMSREAGAIWKAAFRRSDAAHLPQCPPTVTEPQWAFMLFGPGICLVCGKYGALTDFAFLKQYCGPCMDAKYAHSKALKDLNNRAVQPNHIVFQLIPRSHRYHGIRYTSTYADPAGANARYLLRDFERMIRKVTLIQLLIDHKVPRLAELFDEYKVALSAHLRAMEKASNTANCWAENVFKHNSADYYKALQQGIKACTKRLKNRGHEGKDVDDIQASIACTLRDKNIYRWTSKAFKFKVLPVLEALVAGQKAKRLEKMRASAASEALRPCHGRQSKKE